MIVFQFQTYMLIFLMGFAFGSSKVLKTPAVRFPSFSKPAPNKIISATYVPEPRSVSHRNRAATPATPDRPLVRYWNNFVRNIRVPVPTITWNMTNPFINLFNAGATNVIDTPVRDYDNSNKRRKRKGSKNRRKQLPTVTKYTKRQKYTPPVYNGYNEGVQHAVGSHDPHRNPTFNVNTAMFFYDTKTGQYFKIQHPPPHYINNYASEEDIHEPAQQEQQLQNAIEEEQEADNINMHEGGLDVEQETDAVENEQPAEEAEEEVPEIEQIASPDSEATIEGTSAHEEEQMFSDVPQSETEGHVGGEVILVPENDAEFEEERTLASHTTKKFIFDMKPNVKNLKKFRNSMRFYVIRDRDTKKHHHKSTKEEAKSKFIVYVLQF